MAATDTPAAAAAMPLDLAHDALSDCVSQFHNDMLRQGIKELSPRQWVEEFRSWLDPCSFERDYEDTKKWLASLDARGEG